MAGTGCISSAMDSPDARTARVTAIHVGPGDSRVAQIASASTRAPKISKATLCVPPVSR